MKQKPISLLKNVIFLKCLHNNMGIFLDLIFESYKMCIIKCNINTNKCGLMIFVHGIYYLIINSYYV